MEFFLKNYVNPRREAWRQQQRNRKSKTKGTFNIEQAPDLLMEFSTKGYLKDNNIVGSYIGKPDGFLTDQPFVFVVEVLHGEAVPIPHIYRGIIIKQIEAKSNFIDDAKEVKEVINVGIMPEESFDMSLIDDNIVSSEAQETFEADMTLLFDRK
jgi:hypothetical protein